MSNYFFTLYQTYQPAAPKIKITINASSLWKIGPKVLQFWPITNPTHASKYDQTKDPIKVSVTNLPKGSFAKPQGRDITVLIPGTTLLPKTTKSLNLCNSFSVSSSSFSDIRNHFPHLLTNLLTNFSCP